MVDQMADYLHTLRDQELALTDDQAAHIIRLWRMLTDFDKQPTDPKARHRTQITKVSTATYRKKGAQSVVPGDHMRRQRGSRPETRRQPHHGQSGDQDLRVPSIYREEGRPEDRSLVFGDQDLPQHHAPRGEVAARGGRDRSLVV
ncbi:hypothetical protein MAR_026725 [Mya arenaria]|uniref:Uncharacterized protein n=1 Tax=Mya arenaria TaxID=6604 RepID=A0ABY7ERC7_MYAAR|nr:hypothetical protein MAR_026725 [Mya arenaria]